MKKDRGFSLPETMIASGFLVFLMASIFSVTHMLNKINNQYQTETGLTTKARLTVDRMAFGMRQAGQTNRRGIAEAVSATVSPTQVDYTDVDGVLHSIRYNNGNIEYRAGAAGSWSVLLDPNGTPVFDASIYSVNLSFSQTNPRAVIIRLTLGKTVGGVWRYASISTSVALRNS